MSIQSAAIMSLDFFPKKNIEIEPTNMLLTSDAGLLPIRQLDEALQLTQQFTATLDDLRRQYSVQHSFLEMVRSRIYGILADYPDQNDHEVLRCDPLFKMIAGKSPDDKKHLACQATLSRFENGITFNSLKQLEDVFIEQFIDSFDEPPSTLTFDVDAFDDPTHGQQQLTMFHGFYDQYQYLPVVWTCAETDAVVMLKLLWGSADVSHGIEDDIERLVTRLRARFPDVRIIIRADAGYAKPVNYQICEDLNVEYSIGFSMNPVLIKQSEKLLLQAIKQYEKTGIKQRLFHTFAYQAGSWQQARQVILKVEYGIEGVNRRAVVTNRPGAAIVPEGIYDDYSDRGESENRNKELKCGLQADRLSDHRYMANLFRLNLHCAAHNLLVRSRKLIADPPVEKTIEGVPPEAQSDLLRRSDQNRRRQRDPLGEGQPCTWRSRLIKVAALIEVSCRRIVVRLAEHWPYVAHFEKFCTVAMSFSSAVRPPD